MSVLSALDRFNRTHPWSHNDAFTGFVLRHAGRPDAAVADPR
jgi:hypothetical protein